MEFLKLVVDQLKEGKWQGAFSNLTKVVGIDESGNAYFRVVMPPKIYSSALDLLQEIRQEAISLLLSTPQEDIEKEFEQYIRPFHNILTGVLLPLEQDQILSSEDQGYLDQCEQRLTEQPVSAVLGISLFVPLGLNSSFRQIQGLPLPYWFVPYYATRLVIKEREHSLECAKQAIERDELSKALSHLAVCVYPLPLTAYCTVSLEAISWLSKIHYDAQQRGDVDIVYSCLNLLRQIRNFVVPYLLELPNDVLASTFQASIQHYYNALQSFNLYLYPLSDEEQTTVKNLQRQFYSKQGQEGKQIQIMLALGLYDLPYRVVPFVSIPLNEWFLDFYWNQFIDRCPLFLTQDDADKFIEHKEKVLQAFRNIFLSSKDSPQWLKRAKDKLSNDSFFTILISEANLQSLATVWSDIAEECIRRQGIPLEHLIAPRSSDRHKIRIGAMGTWFNKGEIKGHFPYFGYLPREEFEVFYYLTSPPAPEIYDRIADKVDKILLLEGELLDRVRAIREDDLDVLILGTNLVGRGGIDYQLSRHRLARVQIATQGSPSTTGAKYADYYISGELNQELESAQDYYREELILVPGTIHRFAYRELPPPPSTMAFHRGQFGFPSDAIIFASGTSFVKFTPLLVKTWAEILVAIPKSYLVLYPFGGTWISNLKPVVSFSEFVNRILSNYGITEDRVLILGDALPSPADCIELLKVCDIYLDAFPMSGTYSMSDALEANIPIVAPDGKQFRVRQAAAILRSFGLDELVAPTREEYIALAIKLAQDKDFYRRTKEKIRAVMTVDDPYDSKGLAKSLEQVYRDLVKRWDEEGYIKQFKVVGDECLLHGNLATAEQCYCKALELRPDDAGVIANLGTIHVCANSLEKAEELYRRAIEIDPKLAKAYWMLGNLLKKKGDEEEAEKYHNQALEIQPDLLGVKNYMDLGAVQSGRGEHEKALKFLTRAAEMQPNNKVILMQLARTLCQLERYQEAIQHLERLLELNPENPEFSYEIGKTLVEINRIDEGIPHLEKAIEINPYYVAAHSQLCNAYNKLANHFGRDDAWLKWRQSAWNFARLCKDFALVETTMCLMSALLHAGLNQDERLLSQIKELEELLEDEERVQKLPPSEIAWLYVSIIFSIQDIRDDRKLNCELAKKIGKLYTEKMVLPGIDRDGCRQRLQTRIKEQPKTLDRSLKVGIVSPYFRRHSVGWCSFDAIAELATMTPVYLYSSDKIGDKDSRTQQFEAAATKFFNPSIKARAIQEVLEEIAKDEIDVLIELDSVTAPHHLTILNSYVAPVRCSWLGFDAPFTSSENYFIGDWYTHPGGVEDCYTEKIVRVPDSHMSIGYFAHVPLDREAIRRTLQVDEDQVIYLYTPSARKFNIATAKAHVSILKGVEKSILYRKATGDVAAVRQVYYRECEAQGVDPKRVLVVAKTKTEEEHRGIYPVADVFLDSHPYNGGTQNMEALYSCLPAVTHVGDTAFGRMGLSFLSTLGIKTGIAYSWEEYIEWGIRYGTDRDLRLSVHEHMKKARQPDSLSPLWNPNKFAKDLLDLLTKLYLAEINRDTTL
jgi:protein O-GlcNAc transferase